MTKKKTTYVFLTLKSIESCFVYAGFNSVDNGKLILIDRGKLLNSIARKIIRFYTESGHGQFLVRGLTQRIIQNQVIREIAGIDSSDIVFILYARVYETFGREIADELRKAFPESKLCVYFADLQKRFTIDLKCYRRDFDYLFSFDKKQADKYGMSYLLEPFTYKSFPDVGSTPIFDVTYVGRVKNDMKRYNDIIRVYEQCRNAGLRCDFHIVDVPPKQQKYADEIEYNKFMDFKDIIRHVIQSHAVLEILQTDEYSPTTRYTEACLYGRNLLTNCDGIKDGFYIKEDNIYLLDDGMRIDAEWIEAAHPIDFDSYKKMFSIESFIVTVEKTIQGHNKEHD